MSDGLTTTGSVTSAAVVVSVSNAGYSGGSFQITSIGTSNNVSFEQSNDGVTWTTLYVNSATTSTGAATTSMNAVGMWVYNSSAAFVRARVSAYTSGTVSISMTQKRSAPQVIGLSLATSSAASIGIVNPSTGYTDSSTALASSATYTGTGRTNSGAGWAYFNATAFADQAGTLYIDQSTDTGATYRQIASIAITAGAGQTLRVPLTGAVTTATLYRVRYVNGATAQGAFSISSSFTAF